MKAPPVSERERVIISLCRRLQACGIHPERTFAATFIPGLGWSFSAEAGSSSSSAGGARCDDDKDEGSDERSGQ